MPVRFEINGGLLEVRQSFDFPAIYLDHWAVALFSRDVDLGARFLRALRRSGGSLVVSTLNFVEVTGGSDPRNVEQAAMFFELALPRKSYCAGSKATGHTGPAGRAGRH
jgi:hypothetical protein